MKLYLSSYRIPNIAALESLLEKPLSKTRIAVIPNAKDYYSENAWNYKVNQFVEYMKDLSESVDVIDLRTFNSKDQLEGVLLKYDLIWAAGGNTYCLRYEMQRSGFDEVIMMYLAAGKVYGGESAGALVAGVSIAGLESADEPNFAPSVITEGLKLVPYVVLPHVGSPDFTTAIQEAEATHSGKNEMIKLTDYQAAVFDDGKYSIVES